MTKAEVLAELKKVNVEAAKGKSKMPKAELEKLLASEKAKKEGKPQTKDLIMKLANGELTRQEIVAKLKEENDVKTSIGYVTIIANNYNGKLADARKKKAEQRRAAEAAKAAEAAE